MSTGVIARRRTRLGVIVAVASVLVAVGVTGAGLLVPGGEGTPAVRVAAALAALTSGAVVVRLDGAARAVSGLIVACMAGSVVCLVTLPVSPVTLDLDASSPDAESGGARDEGVGDDGSAGDVGPGAGDLPGAGSGVVELPAGADVVLEDGQVVLTDPGGSRYVLGTTDVRGSSPATNRDTSIVVADGVVRRSDGAQIGGDVALGGTTFERSDGSRVAVGDGALLDVPDPLEADDPRAERVDALVALLLGIFTVLAFAPPAIRFGQLHPVPLLDEPEPQATRETERPAVSVEAGLADVLRSMLADPDPRTSVIGAYARLLTAMAEAGHPRRDEEGPHEHLWRTLAPLGVRRQPVHRLAELFVRARFTPRPVTEADRQSAIVALADAVADLRLRAEDVDEVVARVGVAG